MFGNGLLDRDAMLFQAIEKFEEVDCISLTSPRQGERAPCFAPHALLCATKSVQLSFTSQFQLSHAVGACRKLY